MSEIYEDKRFIDILKDFLNGTLKDIDEYLPPPTGDTLDYPAPINKYGERKENGNAEFPGHSQAHIGMRGVPDRHIPAKRYKGPKRSA